MINLDEIKGAIFDVDGTMLDSMRMWHDIEIEYLMKHGISGVDNWAEVRYEMSQAEVGEYFQKEYGIKKSVQEITAEKNAMLDEFYFNAAALKPGVVAFLEALKARGVKMCVATATDRYLIEASLSRVGIDKYFERIFTCNEERTSKSSPDIFIRAAKFLGTDVGETVVVEDASHAIRSAKSAGFKVMAVFDQSAAAHQEEIRAMSDYYYTSLDDLIY